MSEQGQEKWSSVRITDSKKNSIKVENHVSIHSNLNLNGLCPSDQKGNEVKAASGGGEVVLKRVFDFMLCYVLSVCLMNEKISLGLNVKEKLVDSLVELIVRSHPLGGIEMNHLSSTE